MGKGQKEIDAKIQRRVLRLINAARGAEDMAEAMKLSPGEACKLIELRDASAPFGFHDLRPVLDLLGDRLLDIIREYFEARRYGKWRTVAATPGDEARAAHAALVRTADPEKGRVLLISGHAQHIPGYKTTPFLWDPEAPDPSSAFSYPDNEPDDDLYCSGHAFLSDGRLLAVGGGGSGPNDVNRAWKFDPLAGANGTWERTAGDMAYAQWYPTVVNLGDGRFLAVGGEQDTGVVQVYHEWLDGFHTVSLPAPVDFEQNYPGLHLVPYGPGAVFYTSTGFGNAGSGPYVGDIPTGTFQLQFTGTHSAQWHDLPGDMAAGHRVKGMSVPLFIGPMAGSWLTKILVVGGNGQATAEIYDFASMSWSVTSEIPGDGDQKVRNNPNAVALPDGNVFVCGGSTGSQDVYTSAMYDSFTGEWKPMDELEYGRAYHSVALLLPSGEVMVTGGSADSPQNRTIEIFSPPYLFRGERPHISTAPEVIHHGRIFEVESPDAGDIERVVLVRPMAVTHQTDTEQRVVGLMFDRDGNVLRVRAPGGIHPHPLAPRGYYLLFLVNGAGVPSRGRFVRLH